MVVWRSVSCEILLLWYFIYQETEIQTNVNLNWLKIEWAEGKILDYSKVRDYHKWAGQYLNSSILWMVYEWRRKRTAGKFLDK